ncbi:MAG TPA: hypothetical protein VGX48_15910 [Pyrinomonadaceae bacterium]|jgi:tetratricopeptide (TPR) repeat protein|nr:hypothetical protein [Pyrinomonadaceae bacterium]
MSEASPTEETIRGYLLGRLEDEATMEAVEELLFTDDEFSSRVALAEDGLVNDFVLGRLDERDAESFRATLAGNPERRLNVELSRALRRKALDAAPSKAAEASPSLLDSLRAFLRRPTYAGAFAALVLAAVGIAVNFGRGDGPGEMAALREIYKQGRPTEARISGFDYAPLAELRGEPDRREQGRLRGIELKLLDAAEKSPGARSRRELGEFYLTQRKYEDAVREFEGALKFDGDDARIHSDLGAAYFELAKSSAKERRLELLSRSLEELKAATRLDGDLLEALFNRSLVLQELSLPREAKESWSLYLQKDSSSPWAEEARSNIARLEREQARFKGDAQVLDDFLAAYRGHDDARARKIHDETKGTLKGVAVPLQLSRRYLLATRRGDGAEAAESVAALDYLGRYEREAHSEFFFLSWPTSTPAWAATKSSGC